MLSVRDLMLCEELSHIPNEVSLLHPDNDALVASLLEQVGFNIKKEWTYIPSLHRDMREKAQVGFQIVGEYNTDPKYRHLLDMTDKIVVAGMVDPSLAKEMLEIMGKRFQYKNDEEDVKSRKRPNDPRYYSEEELLEMGYSTGEDEEEVYEDEDDSCNSVTSQIAALQSIKVAIRGE